MHFWPFLGLCVRGADRPSLFEEPHAARINSMTRANSNVPLRSSQPRRASPHHRSMRLCGVLGYLRFLRHWYETMHWNASGSSSYGDHLLYERLYDSTDANIDTLAEKIVQLFGAGALTAKGNLQCMNDAMSMAESCMNQSPLGETPEVALVMERGLQDLLALVFEEMDYEGSLSMGLNDFLMSLASSHETHLYLLQQRLGGSPGAASEVCEHGHVHAEPHVCGVDCDGEDARGLMPLPGRASGRGLRAAADRNASRKLRPHLTYLQEATKVLMQDPPPRTADDDLAVALRKAVVACADLAKLDGNSKLSSRLNQLTGRIQVPEVIMSALQPRQALSWAVKRGLPTGPLGEGVMWLGTYMVHLSGQHPVLKDVGLALQHAAPLSEGT